MMKSPKKRIFIFAAGWRTGSTLLQRLITSSGQIFVWGELHDLGDIYLNTIKKTKENCNKWFNADTLESKITNTYDNYEDANLNPPPNSVYSAAGTFLDRLYYSELIYNKYEGWGWKTVRYASELYYFLKTIYPDAKFIFLVRNPFQSLESAKSAGYYDGLSFKKTVNLYVKLYMEFLQIKKDNNIYIVRFEDLIASEMAQANLFNYLDINYVDIKNLKNTSKKKHVTLSSNEILYINKNFSVMEKFGYKNEYRKKMSVPEKISYFSVSLNKKIKNYLSIVR